MKAKLPIIASLATVGLLAFIGWYLYQREMEEFFAGFDPDLSDLDWQDIDL